jgi:hypothetical protein
MATNSNETLRASQRSYEDALRDWKSFEGSNEGTYSRAYPGAFSASNAYALLRFPGATRKVGQLAALSVSTHRDTFPVGSMPFVSAKGFTQGRRMVAGTLIFHTIDRSVLANRYEHSYLGRHFIHDHADELPLFDILVVYVNEEGMASFEEVIGVRVVDFGRTVSLENLNPAETYSYMAIDYRPLRTISHGDPRDPRLFPGRVLNREKKALSNERGVPYQTYDPILGETLSSPAG